MLKLPSLKKRKNPSRQEVQESGSKKTRGSAPKMSVKTYDVEVTSEAGKNVVEETIEIVDDHVSAEKVQEKMVGNPSKRSSRAFGPAAATPEVSKKKVTKTKRRKLKLTAEEEDEYEKEEAIRIIEELKEKEAAEEALLVDSSESSEKAVPNQFLDGPFSKEDLVVKFTNRGIY
jgi:preprotein translocase subunit SecD